MRPVRAFALIVVGVLVLSACRIDARVNVQVDDDGSGRVRVRVVLDPEAVRAADSGTATLEDRVRLGDLPAAGWRVRAWDRRPDGSAALELRRPFSSPAELTTVMADLSGADGPLRAVRLQRGSGLARATFDFRALADLAGVESGVATDEQLAASLSAQRVDVAGLDAALTARLRDSLRMEVAVGLPGAGTRVWHLPPGTRAVLEARSSQLDVGRVVWLASAVVLGGAALALALLGGRRSRRRRPRAESHATDGATGGSWPGSS